MLSTPEDRTKSVADVVKFLAGELIPGIRNEVLVITKYLVFNHTPYYQKKLCWMSHRFAGHISTSYSFCKFRLSYYLQLYPVKSSFGTPEFFSLERAAAPYFGIKVHNIYHIIHNYIKLFHLSFLLSSISFLSWSMERLWMMSSTTITIFGLQALIGNATS